jgi:lysophospholipase L1-like esterase
VLRAQVVALDGSAPALTGAEALAPFYERLRALESGRDARAGVLFFGNSMISADFVVDVVRARLTARFGDSGRGFLLADRAERPVRADGAAWAPAGHWRPFNIGNGPRGRAGFGAAGVRHVATRSGAFSVVPTATHDSMSVLWTPGPRAARLHLVADGRRDELVAGEAAVAVSSSHVTLRASGYGATLHGVVLRADRPGVSVSAFAVPGADARDFLRTSPALFERQVRAVDPALIVVMLGGNEARRLRRRYSVDEMEAHLEELVVRARSAAPESACVVVSPLERVVGRGRAPLRPVRGLDVVLERQRRVAARQGCALLDLYRAAGGEGAIGRWHRRGLMHRDLSHPTRRGREVLGQLVVDGLLAGYDVGDQTALR